MKEIFSYATDDEVVTGFKADRTKAAHGIGTGFNSHAGTGTIASATEQRKQADRGESMFIRNTMTTARPKNADADAKAALYGLQLSVIDTALRLNGFNASWTVTTATGVEVIDPRNVGSQLVDGLSTLACSISTALPAEEAVDGISKVTATMAKALRNLDSLEGGYDGTGQEFFVLMASSPVVAISIAESGSALADLVAAASAVVAKSAHLADGNVFAVDASDLTVCPVCQSVTERTDMVCRNGHASSAAVRAEQESIVLEAAFTAAAEAKLELNVTAKVKNSGKIDLAGADLSTFAAAGDVVAKVSFATPTLDLSSAWAGLTATTTMRTALEAALSVHTNGAQIRSRVLRSVMGALDKAADAAADVIATPVRDEIAAFIVAVERERSAQAWIALEAEYRKELVAAANRPSQKQLKEFRDTTNKYRGFVKPDNARGNSAGTGRRQRSNRAGQATAHGSRRDLNGRKRRSR